MKRNKLFVITVSLLCLILVAAGPALALEKGRGVFKKAKFYSETPWTAWSDGTLKDIFDVNIKLRGDKPQCIEIRFSAAMFAAIQSEIICYVDGVLAEPGLSFWFNPASAGNQNAAYVWWQCGLASGGASHNVRVEFDPGSSEDMGFGPRNLVIEYKK